jgi:hypothetical protein
MYMKSIFNVILICQIASTNAKRPEEEESLIEINDATRSETEETHGMFRGKKTKKQPVECVLEATLGYPFDDPDEASYMGYHQDWLLVEKDEGLTDEDYCWNAKDGERDWCSVSNSCGDAEYGGAYIGNVDDYYTEWAAKDDRLNNETFTIEDIAGKTIYFKVTHYFFDKDYYSNYEVWSDHMLVPTLTITNLSQNETLKEGGWARPVDINVKTHTEAGDINPDYSKYFYVTVVCSEDCDCHPTDYSVYYDEGE